MGLEVTTKIKLPEAVVSVHLSAWGLVRSAAHIMQTAAKLKIEEAEGAGIKWENLPHRSSAPGAHPVNQFGNVLASIIIEEPPAIGNIIAVDVTSTSKITDYLETGTNRMEPRPFMTESALEAAEYMATADDELKIGFSIV